MTRREKAITTLGQWAAPRQPLRVRDEERAAARLDGEQVGFTRRSNRHPIAHRLASIAFFAAFAASALWSDGAQAQVQRSFVNPSFEQPLLPGASCYSIRESAVVPGWETTEPTYTGIWNDSSHGTCGGHKASPPIVGGMQMFKNNAEGTSARTGIQWAELNAFTAARLYQNVCMVTGERVDWRLAHKGRVTTERMTFNIGTNPSGAGSQLIMDASTTTAGAGTLNSCGLGTCNLGGTVGGWANYSGSFVWNGSVGVQTIGFQAVTGGSAGNILDDIVLILRPYVEFFPAVASTREDQGAAGVPAIRITGVIETTFNVQVAITGGTATLGTDFSAPGSTFSVTIPAGDYGAGQDFPLPLSVIDDTDIEGDETVTLAIVENPANYVVSSTSVCGGAANAELTWTIVDNDVDLSITKDDGAATYVPGFDVNYAIVVSNAGLIDVIGAQISDPLPADITNASWTCGGATNGGVCGAPSGTGAINTTADLPTGASVTYLLNMVVPSDYTGNLTNTATVAVPAGVTDTNLDNNQASDTDTMEPPPTSGACSPRVVLQGASFTLAPFPTTGTVQKSAANGWHPDNAWATRGGNYTFTWTFTQPIPVSWIRFAVVDVNETSGLDYDANPPVFTITLAGGTATTADFSLADGDLIYSGGALRFRPGGPYRQSGHLQGNGSDTVTSITITSTGVATGDNIANSLFVRPACVTVEKVSEGGTDAFQFGTGNVVEANGTAVPTITLTTTAPDTAVSSTVYYSIIDQNVSVSETVPVGWNLASAVCTDQNAGVTGNPTVIGSFASPTITLPASNVRPQADIRCRFTNDALPRANLTIAKTVTPTTVTSGEEVVYTLLATNNGPDAADGAVVTDPGVPNSLACTALTCSAAGGAACPAAPTPEQLAAGLAIPTFPNGGTVTLALTCTVTATGQ